MAFVFALLTVVCLVYFLWALVSLPLSKRKKTKFTRGSIAFGLMIVSVIFFTQVNNREAQSLGYLDASDKQAAENAGITDPAVWASRREEELSKQREAAAAAKDADDERKRLAGIVAAEEAARIAKAKEVEEQAAQAKAVADKAAKEADCRQDITCWGEEAHTYGTRDCTNLVERMAKFDYEWTDGILEPKFSHFRWANQEDGTVTLIGDRIKFQNGFGAWTHMTYECDFNPSSKEVLDIRVRQGRR